jgi:hypothetical protein
MRIFLKMVLLIVELMGFLGASIFIGFWWAPDFVRGTHGGADGSLLRATGGLVITAVMFHKFVMVTRRHHSSFHFYFYTALAVCTMIGYFYGVFFRWL